MEITRDMLKYGTVFHCDTRKKVIEFCEKLSDLDYKWWDRRSYLNNNHYSDYKENTCYYPYMGAYNNTDFFKNKNYDIIEYELDSKEFAMDDIKDGYLVKLRNGNKYICYNGTNNKKIFVSYDGLLYTDGYDLNLFFKRGGNGDLSELDIVKVYDKSSRNTGFLSLKTDIKTDNRKLLWERKEENKMELKDTVKMMNSEDFKERFKAEYIQTKIRYDKLDEMTVKYEAGTLTFKPICSLELFKEQKKYLGCYIRCLKIRAEIEGIDLS